MSQDAGRQHTASGRSPYGRKYKLCKLATLALPQCYQRIQQGKSGSMSFVTYVIVGIAHGLPATEEKLLASLDVHMPPRGLRARLGGRGLDPSRRLYRATTKNVRIALK